MRRFAVVASVMTFAGGALLYGPSANTETWFAWDIEPPLTAAFLGGSFWATSVVSATAVRHNQWEKVRLVIPAFGVLLLFTLCATLIHLDRFDFRSFFGWTWLAAYVLLPAFLAPILAEQRRLAPPATAGQAFPFAMALALSLLGTAMLAEGVGLFVDPQAAGRLWPWTLTPLTARAVAAWLIALGVAAVHASWERDWGALWPVAVTYTTFGVLQLLALARWGDAVDWGDVAAWIYVGAVLTILALGVLGLARSPRRTTPSPSPAD